MSHSQSLESLALRRRFVIIFSWAFGLVSMFRIGLMAYFTFKGPEGIVVTAGGNVPSIPFWPIIVGIAGVALLLAMIGLFVCSLLWIHRAHTNLAEQNVPMDYSPAWSVGSYFVPFANLIVPLRSMRELYNRSHGEIPEHAHASVDDVSSWWTANVVGLLIVSARSFKELFDTLTNIVFLTPAWMEFAMSSFATLIMIVAAVMLVKIVNAITLAQAESGHVSATFA